jgi:hypothetical protein
MIDVSDGALLSIEQPFQGAPREAATRLCLSLLERGADFGVAVTKVIHLSASKEQLTLAIGDRCQQANASVTASLGFSISGTPCLKATEA